MKIYITTCDKRLSYAKQIKEMLRNCPHEYFFVYGKGNTQKLEPYVEFDFQEAYENLAEKTFCLVEHFLKHFNDEKLLKMNDYTFVDLEKLKCWENVSEDYVGYFNSTGHDEIGTYFHWYKMENPEYKVLKRNVVLNFAEGSMYILSRKACEKILTDGRSAFTNTPSTYLGEDFRVGISLEHPSITKKCIKEPIDLPYEITEDFMSIHPVCSVMFNKLKEAKTNEEKKQVLIKYNFLNENLHRLEYLKKIQPVMKLN